MRSGFGSAFWPLKRATIRTILEHVAFEVECDEADILGPCRKARTARARCATAWLARRFTAMTLAEIGADLGRDGSTVGYAIRRAERLRGSDDRFRRLTDGVGVMIAAI